MIDRLEELLNLMRDEDAEEEPEDEPELGETVFPASPVPEAPAQEDAQGDGGAEAPEEPGGPEKRSGPDRPGEGEPDRPGEEEPDCGRRWDELPEADGLQSAGRDKTAAPMAGAERPLGSGPAADRDGETAKGPEAEDGEAEAPEGPVRPEPEREMELKELYRQVLRASRPAAQSLPAEPVGRAVRAWEGGPPPAGLTVEELDWAVRRDSRRYDGGMTLF